MRVVQEERDDPHKHLKRQLKLGLYDAPRIFAKNRKCKRILCDETTAFGSEFCIHHSNDVRIT